MPIPLGEETVVVQKQLVLRAIRIEGLDSEANKKIHIDYMLNGAMQTTTIEGQAWNDFYTNKWNDGRGIFNDTALRSLLSADLDLETAEDEFLNVIEEVPAEEGQ
jgi:hypothetical protein